MVFELGCSLPEYRIRAFNSAGDSNNLIHNDEYARRFGFRAGLVPGVSIYAYLTHPLVQLLGKNWLERGTADVRFLHAVYDGEEIRVTGTIAEVAGDGSVSIECQAADPSGVTCCTGTAGLTTSNILSEPANEEYPAGKGRLALPISLESLEVGEILTPVLSEFTWQINWEYCQKTVHDHQSVYQKCAHPGWLLSRANQLLAANYALPPWIHVSSTVRNFHTQECEGMVETRGKVADKFERNGHHFVVLDVAVFAEKRCLLTVRHTAIFRIAPRAA